MAKVRSYVDDINAHLADLPCRGPYSRYELGEENGGGRGRLELTFYDSFTQGVACNLESEGAYVCALCGRERGEDLARAADRHVVECVSGRWGVGRVGMLLSVCVVCVCVVGGGGGADSAQ